MISKIIDKNINSDIRDSTYTVEILEQMNEIIENQINMAMSIINNNSIDILEIENKIKLITKKLCEYELNYLNNKENEINKIKMDRLKNYCKYHDEINISSEKLTFYNNEIAEIVIPDNYSLIDMDTINHELDKLFSTQKENNKLIKKYKDSIKNDEIVLEIEKKNFEIFNNKKKILNELREYKFNKINYELDKEIYDKYIENYNYIETQYNIATNLLKQKNSELDRLKEILSKDMEVYSKYELDNTKLSLYQTYLQMMGSNGLPYELIKCYIPMMENEINKIIKNFADFEIEIIYHDKSKEIEYKKTGTRANQGTVNINICRKNMMPSNLQKACGLERFIVNIAIRIAFGTLYNN